MNNSRRIIFGSDRNVLIFLIGANAVMYIFIRMLFIIFQNNQQTATADYEGLYSQFVLPDTFIEFIKKPWTLFLYFFTHLSLRMLFSNMLWLFSFAWLLQNLGGNRYLFPAYFYGGIAGGIMYLLLQLFPATAGDSGQFMDGAAPAILAVAVTTVTLSPQYRIFPFINNGIPVWWLLVIFLLVDLTALSYSRPLLILVHLFAGFTGFLYARGIQRGKDFGAWMRRVYHFVTGTGAGPAVASSGAPARDRLYYTDTSVSPYERKKKITQDLVDELLDKISRKGYESLSAEEKDILKKAKDEL